MARISERERVILGGWDYRDRELTSEEEVKNEEERKKRGQKKRERIRGRNAISHCQAQAALFHGL